MWDEERVNNMDLERLLVIKKMYAEGKKDEAEEAISQNKAHKDGVYPDRTIDPARDNGNISLSHVLVY